LALPRVYDIAKELGIDTKVALAKLEELGEYVKGGSSTIAPPVAAKLRAAFPNAEKPAPKKPAAKSTKAKATTETVEEKPVEEVKVEPKQEKPAAAAPTQNPLTGIPRPGNNPFATIHFHQRRVCLDLDHRVNVLIVQVADHKQAHRVDRAHHSALVPAVHQFSHQRVKVHSHRPDQDQEVVEVAVLEPQVLLVRADLRVSRASQSV